MLVILLSVFPQYHLIVLNPVLVHFPSRSAQIYVIISNHYPVNGSFLLMTSTTRAICEFSFVKVGTNQQPTVAFLWWMNMHNGHLRVDFLMIIMVTCLRSTCLQSFESEEPSTLRHFCVCFCNFLSGKSECSHVCFQPLTDRFCY